MSTRIVQTRKDGQEVILLQNDQLEVWLTNLGASVLKIIVPDQNGNPVDVALGYAELDDYPKYRAYLGATVGRTANRIARGVFELEGKTYHLPVNNGPNCNHGGIDGFSFRLFETHLKDDAVTFTLHSPDGEEGYPGNLDVSVTYSLQGTDLILHYEATSDATTLAAFTNHTYFNLSGRPDYIGDHLLQIHGHAFGEVDENTLFTGRFFDVKDTPMDFTSPAPISRALEAKDPRIDIAKGMDHTFLLDKTMADSAPRDKDSQEAEDTAKKAHLHSASACLPAATLYSLKTGIELQVSTTMPQMQVYTANWFDHEPGKNGMPLRPQSGVALECQHAPDDIHLHPETSRTILKKGEKLDEMTIFSFRIK